MARDSVHPRPVPDVRIGTAAPWSSEAATVWDPPGGVLVWIIVLVELLTFGMGLAVLVVLAGREPRLFAEGRAGLNHGLALINTLVLITGGAWMAAAVAALRRDAFKMARRHLVAAAGSGVVFLGFKGLEYAQKGAQGHGLHHDTFHTVYWLITGFHYLHVAVAVVLLLAVCRGVRPCGDGVSVEARGNVEAAGVFWHLCDVIWLMILPFLYLLP